MNSNNQNSGLQKRMIIMTVLVFVFFIAYEFLVLKPKQIEKMEQQKIEQEQKANAAPEIKEQINSNTSSLAPVVNESKNIVATIKTEKNIIEIDNLGRIYQVTLLEEKYKDDKNNRIKLFAANQLRPLEVRFSNRVLNDEAFKVDVVASSSNIDATTNNFNSNFKRYNFNKKVYILSRWTL